jgi:hypothetical protein
VGWSWTRGLTVTYVNTGSLRHFLSLIIETMEIQMMSIDRSKNPCGTPKYPTKQLHLPNLPLTISFQYRKPNGDSLSLKQSNIQLKLGGHKSEVLALLDCCYRSQAAIGLQTRRRSPVPQIGKTIRLKSLSFTSLLTAEP